MKAPILGIGLQIQFDNWGFEQIELAADVEKAMERHTPTLLVLRCRLTQHRADFRFASASPKK